MTAKMAELDLKCQVGTIFILRKGIGVGGPENSNFPLLYAMKMSLRRGWVVLKSLKTPLRNIKMAPYVIHTFQIHTFHTHSKIKHV